MAVLSGSNLGKSFGTDVIFSGVSFEIQENDRVGLVGVNGSGKTTLLRVLTGELSPEEGAMYKASSAVVGYMEQHVCRDLGRSAYSEVLTGFRRWLSMERELEELNQRCDGEKCGYGCVDRAAGAANRSIQQRGRPDLSQQCPFRPPGSGIHRRGNEQPRGNPKRRPEGKAAVGQNASERRNHRFFWTSPPTIWISPAWNGWRIFSVPIRARMSLFPMTAIFWIGSPTGLLKWKMAK